MHQPIFYCVCSLDYSLFKPREILNRSEDDMCYSIGVPTRQNCAARATNSSSGSLGVREKNLFNYLFLFRAEKDNVLYKVAAKLKG